MVIRRQGTLLSLLLASILALNVVAQDAPSTEPMSPELRGQFVHIIVRPGSATAGQFVTGTYQKDVMDMGEGVARGAEMGRVGREVGGIPIYFPIRVISVPAQILGGLAGKTQEEIQKFRDRLTRDLIEAQDQPMTNEALADDVFWRIRSAPGVKARVLADELPTPPGTDAVLYVSLDSVQLTVENEKAVITTTATATLRRQSDGRDVFVQEFVYSDRDILRDWTRNGDATWRSYAAYARHYIGREIAARLYERVSRWTRLQPVKSPDIKPVKKNAWRGSSRTPAPTLAWDLTVLDSSVDAANVQFDIEVYDTHQLVYAAARVTGESFTLPHELEGCRTYFWSVRPSIVEAGTVRYGEWMRFESGATTDNGSSGSRASAAPAYLSDFPSFEVACKR